MRSFFFIPAQKIHKLDFIQKLGIDEVIIDFEDAVLESERQKLLNSALQINELKPFWFRIPVRNQEEAPINVDFLMQFLQAGVRHIMLPKIQSKDEFQSILEATKHYKGLQFILLIEHPRLLMELQQILQNEVQNEKIHGIGIGSHDLLNFMKAEHQEEQLFFPRMQMLYLGKAYGKEVIDIAAMNISDKVQFEQEVLFGLTHGFDAKFIIHPQQLEWMQNFDRIQIKQLDWAKKVIAALPKEHIGNEIEPFIFEGQIIEKPHVEKAYAILKKYKNGK